MFENQSFFMTIAEVSANSFHSIYNPLILLLFSLLSFPPSHSHFNLVSNISPDPFSLPDGLITAISYVSHVVAESWSELASGIWADAVLSRQSAFWNGFSGTS